MVGRVGAFVLAVGEAVGAGCTSLCTSTVHAPATAVAPAAGRHGVRRVREELWFLARIASTIQSVIIGALLCLLNIVRLGKLRLGCVSLGCVSVGCQRSLCSC